jgi:hypothetical protein
MKKGVRIADHVKTERDATPQNKKKISIEKNIYLQLNMPISSVSTV